MVDLAHFPTSLDDYLMAELAGSCPAADLAIPIMLHWCYDHLPEAPYIGEQGIYGEKHTHKKGAGS